MGPIGYQTDLRRLIKEFDVWDQHACDLDMRSG